jgi:glycosyltransferase involved in cell wall biosynthesis
MKVSVIIPNYNYGRYLPERLNSIISQTYRPFEIIFLDDNSEDDSVEVAKKILEASGIPHRVIRNSVNEGCFKQWFRGIHEAKGDLIWIAEADDSCDSKLLATLVAKFDDPKVGLAYCQSLRMDPDGTKGDSYLSRIEKIPGSGDHWRKDYVNEGSDEIRRYLAVKNTIVNASAVLMRRDLLLRVSDIGGGFSQVGDWYTYIQILKSSKIAFSPAPLNYHRRRCGNSATRSGTMSKEERRQLFYETLDLHKLILSEFHVSKMTRILIFLEHARMFCKKIL